MDTSGVGCIILLLLYCIVLHQFGPVCGTKSKTKSKTSDKASTNSRAAADTTKELLATVDKLSTVVDDLSARIDTLVASVKELEKQENLFKRVIAKQQADLEDHQFNTEKIESQIQHHQELGEQLQGLQDSVKDLEKLAVSRYRESKAYTDQCDKQNKLLEFSGDAPVTTEERTHEGEAVELSVELSPDAVHEELLVKLKEKIKFEDMNRQEEPARKDVDPVAFQARLAKTSLTNIRRDHTIIFDQDILNLGDHFDIKTGIFTAHKTGTYLFSLTVMSYPDERVREIDAAIVKENEIIASAFAHGDDDHNDQGSVTVATTLKIGERVWVRNLNIEGSALWGHGFSSFMGVLVIPF